MAFRRFTMFIVDLDLGYCSLGAEECLASNPGSLSGGGEREPGTHCLRMRKVYGTISSIIRWTLSLPRGRTCTDKVY